MYVASPPLLPSTHGLPPLRDARATPNQRLWALVALERQDLGTMLVFSAAIGLLTLALPVATQILVNTLAFVGQRQPLVLLALVVFAVLMATALLIVLRYRIVEIVKQRLFVRAAHEAATRLSTADIDAFGPHGPIAAANYFYDIMTLQKAAAELLLAGTAALLQGTLALVLLAFYHPWFLLLGLLVVGGIGLIIKVLGANGVATALKASKAKHNVANWLVQLALGQRTFKLAQASEFALAHVDALAANYVLARRKHFTVLMRQTFATYVLAGTAMAGLLGLGGMLIVAGQLSLGQLVAAEVLTAGLVTGLSKLGSSLASYYDASAAVDKLGQLAALPTETLTAGPARPDPREPHGGQLEARGVTLTIDGQRRLHTLNLRLLPGSRTAIFGDDGAGKTLLADVLWGLRTPTHGQIWLDGLDLGTLGTQALRAAVALVSAPELVEGTVLDNILLGRPALHEAELSEVLTTADLHDALATWPQGLNTKLGIGGVRLSSSQAARLMIARALVGRPRVVLLDGTLDGLAAETIDRITTALQQPRLACTLLIFTSRQRVARAFAQRLCLRDGSLAPLEGHHDT